MTRPTRRRFFGLMAGLGAAALSGSTIARRPTAFEWRGSALGAEARIVIDHPDKNHASRAVALAVAEIDRLENEFSLFRADSTVSTLNRVGHIAAPSLDMRRLVQESIRIAKITGGLFDVTIQPYWQAVGRITREGEAAAIDLEAVRRLVDWRQLRLDDRGLSLDRAGMALSFNGIAQGYIADRVAQRLRDDGFDHVLVDAGELRAIGPRRDARPWRVGLRNGAFIDLPDGAVATSSGGASPFVPDGSSNHLIDPRSGLSPPPERSVTVVAEDAATADALATALCLLPSGDIPRMLRIAGGRTAIVTETDGSVTRFRI